MSEQSERYRLTGGYRKTMLVCMRVTSIETKRLNRFLQNFEHMFLCEKYRLSSLIGKIDFFVSKWRTFKTIKKL